MLNCNWIFLTCNWYALQYRPTHLLLVNPRNWLVSNNFATLEWSGSFRSHWYLAYIPTRCGTCEIGEAKTRWKLCACAAHCALIRFLCDWFYALTLTLRSREPVTGCAHAHCKVHGGAKICKLWPIVFCLQKSSFSERINELET